MKLKAFGVLVVVAALGLLGIAGCAEEPGKAVGPIDTSKAPTSSEDAAKEQMQAQKGMYGGGKASPPSSGGIPGKPGKR